MICAQVCIKSKHNLSLEAPEPLKSIEQTDKWQYYESDSKTKTDPTQYVSKISKVHMSQTGNPRIGGTSIVDPKTPIDKKQSDQPTRRSNRQARRSEPRT
jgi:hypothetical protein